MQGVGKIHTFLCFRRNQPMGHSNLFPGLGFFYMPHHPISFVLYSTVTFWSEEKIPFKIVTMEKFIFHALQHRSPELKMKRKMHDAFFRAMMACDTFLTFLIIFINIFWIFFIKIP